MLFTRFLPLLSLWRPVFQQERSFQRAVRQAVGALLVVGPAMLTRILLCLMPCCLRLWLIARAGLRLWLSTTRGCGKPANAFFYTLKPASFLSGSEHLCYANRGARGPNPLRS